VKGLLHAGPRFAFRTILQELLHGIHNAPSFLWFIVPGHLLHIGRKVIAGMLEIAEKDSVPEQN
jgi:hypothetical protein